MPTLTALAPNEYRFEIDVFTPDTIPMSRLCEYMADLADLLGEHERVHFVGITHGSLGVLAKVEVEASPKVEGRLSAIQGGEGDPKARSAIINLNKRLREDNGVGALILHGRGEVIRFPGRDAPTPEIFGPLRQQSAIDGVVILIGGKNDPVPVHVDTDDGIVICSAKRDVARRLGQHLFATELRLTGTGSWIREEDGVWTLKSFRIGDFSTLDQTPLTTAIESLRRVPGSQWNELDDPWEELFDLRDEGNSAD